MASLRGDEYKIEHGDTLYIVRRDFHGYGEEKMTFGWTIYTNGEPYCCGLFPSMDKQGEFDFDSKVVSESHLKLLMLQALKIEVPQELQREVNAHLANRRSQTERAAAAEADSHVAERKVIGRPRELTRVSERGESQLHSQPDEEDAGHECFADDEREHTAHVTPPGSPPSSDADVDTEDELEASASNMTIGPDNRPPVPPSLPSAVSTTSAGPNFGSRS